MAIDKRRAIDQALDFTKQGRFDRAIAEYQVALKADPSDAAIYNALGDLYARTGARAEAINQFLRLGELYRGDGLTVKAIAVYKKVIKQDPTNLAAYLACADLYAEQGLVVESREHLLTVAEHYTREGLTRKVLEIYQKIADLSPGNLTSSLDLAEMLIKEGLLGDALGRLEKVAHAYQAAGENGKAEEIFRRMLTLRPNAVPALLGLGRLYQAQGDYARAMEAIAAATEAKPNDVGLHCLLGQIGRSAGRPDRAIAAYRRALAVSEEAFDARQALVELLLDQRDLEGAFEEAERIAEPLRASERWAAAAAVYEEFTARDPAFQPARERLGPIYLALLTNAPGNRALTEKLDAIGGYQPAPAAAEPEPAFVTAEEAELAAAPPVTADAEDDPQVDERLAEADVYIKYGLIEKAMENLQATLTLSPSNVLARSKLRKIYLEQGRFEEAAREGLAIARTCIGRGLTAQAAFELERAAEHDPSNMEVQQALVDLRRKMHARVEVAPDASAHPAEASAGLTPPTATEPVLPEAASAPGPSLFDAPTAAPLPPEPVAPAPGDEQAEAGLDQAIATARYLAEATALVDQGRSEEARLVYGRILLRDPYDVDAHRGLAELEARPGPDARATAAEEAPPPASEPLGFEVAVRPLLGDQPPVFKVQEAGGPTEGGFVDFAGELAKEIRAADRREGMPRSELVLEEILKEFKKGVREHLAPEDYETHFNLGLAYNEMDLYDEAIEQFRLAGRHPARSLSAANLIGLCFLAKGQPDAAAVALEEGLQVPGRPAPEYRALRYDLASAYEAAGDLGRAQAELEALAAEDPGFRDVRVRLRELMARAAPQTVAPAPAARPARRPPRDRIAFV